MNEEFLFSIRDYAVFKGVTEGTARSRLEEMVKNGQAKKIKTANAPKHVPHTDPANPRARSF